MYETLFENVIIILPITFQKQNQARKPGKNSKCLVWELNSCINYVKAITEYNFWWNSLKFSDKNDLTIQMIIFNNAKDCHAIC